MDWWKNLIQKLNDPEQPEEIRALQKKVKLQAVTSLAAISLVLILVFAMTAAWYTNIAKTSDLTFQTEAWGFEEERITVADESVPVTIAPGTSGIVPLTIDNSDRSEGVEIGVMISKRLIEDEELRKRIYFYADTGHTYTFTESGDVSGQSEGETVSRIYLGATEADSYSYQILPGQKLTLSENYYNDVPIKWMWVYDMLGYYFRGTVGTDVSVDEYLRPIEYDYEEAAFDDDGQLMQTGLLTRDEFLTQLSETDGYEGVINPATPCIPTGEGEAASRQYYYPVQVDQDGYGVWVYLCRQDEIEAGIEYDSQLSQQESGVTVTAEMTLTAVNTPSSVQEAAATEDLMAYMMDGNTDVVKLQQDLYLNEPITMDGDMSKVLDLNGRTIEYSGTEAVDDMFAIRGGASLTLMNGSVCCSMPGTSAFAAEGSELTLSNVTVTGFDTAVDVSDNIENTEESKDSTIRIIGCTLDTEKSAVIFRGNGSATEAATKVIIQDCAIISDYIGVCGQGATNNWGTELILLDSVVEGQYAALYQPQQRSTATVTGCTLRGITGVAVKGGSVTITDCTVTGTGPYGEAANMSGGFTDTGDGIYVEAGYDWSVRVVLKGQNTIISQYAYAVELFGVSEKGPGKVLVYDGTFTGEAGSVKWNGIGNFEIHGGTYQGEVIAPEDSPIVRYDQ